MIGRMRALGVWCKKAEVMLAVAEEGELVEDPHQRIQAAALLDATERLRAVQDDLTRVLAEVAPDQVRVLMPEQTYKGSYGQIAPRAALETVVRLTCVDAGVPVEMLHRSSARARLGMKRSGSVESQIPDVVGEPVGKYWADGRRLAAVAALAGE
jgi:hypothetical protein